MTKRYFYTDPLAAAWMAKHFGMRFANHNNGTEITMENLLRHALTGNVCGIHVHPDSFHVLEPRVGDILRLYFYSPEEDDKHAAVMTGFYSGGREAITWFRDPKDGGIEKQVHKIDDHQWRIIQRHELAFHMPESEGTCS